MWPKGGWIAREELEPGHCSDETRDGEEAAGETEKRTAGKRKPEGRDVCRSQAQKLFPKGMTCVEVE